MSLLSRLLGGAAKVGPADAVERQRAGAVLLDVRTREEYRSGRAPRSRNIPLDALPGRMRELPQGRDVLVVCRSGARSARAAALLRAAGREVHDVRGGMLAWERAGLPVERR